MPLSSILILSGIVAGFAAFGLGLAWAEFRTRDLGTASNEVLQPKTEMPSQLKKAA